MLGRGGRLREGQAGVGACGAATRPAGALPGLAGLGEQELSQAGAGATAAGLVGPLPLTAASRGRQGHSLWEPLGVLEQMMAS